MGSRDGLPRSKPLSRRVMPCGGALVRGSRSCLGVNPGHAAHTYRDRRVVLGCAQEDLEDADHNILYYRNGVIRYGAQGRVIEISCDRHASDGRGGGAGAQGSSGQAPQPWTWRHAGVTPAATGFRIGNGTLRVRTGQHHHRTAGLDPRPAWRGQASGRRCPMSA